MHRRSRLRGALLVAQGALSALLLVGAGLFVRSLVHARDLRLGYDVDPLLLLQYERRGTPIDSAGRVALRARMLDAALAVPGVERGAWTTSGPFASGTSTLSLSVPGVDSLARLGRFTMQVIGPGYFETIGTRIVLGRPFSRDDIVAAPRVVVVSEAMAATLWPRTNPIGQCLRIARIGIVSEATPCTTVIGIAENAVHDPAADLPLRYYLPESQLDWGATWLLVRTRGEPSLVADDVRRAVQAVVPGQMFVTARPALELMDAKRRSWLIGAILFVALGGLALVVAAVGLYGAIAYDVSRRMHEVGVRLALGARRSNIVGLVIGQGAWFATVGFVLGSGLALGAARWLQPLLFQQSARDPIVYAGVGAVLIGVALVASGLPAARAAKADPNLVLRSE
jgi:predicted permease